MNPETALIITTFGIIITAGIITALTFRFIIVTKILKMHGEKLFSKKEIK